MRKGDEETCHRLLEDFCKEHEVTDKKSDPTTPAGQDDRKGETT